MRPVAPLLLLFVLATGCAEPEPTVAPEPAEASEGDLAAWEKRIREQWSGFERVEQGQPWFEVFAVAPGVRAIYEGGHWENVVSYLVEGDERALLFDTGLGIGDMKRVVGELTALSVVVVNSHAHYDHIGGNHAFDGVLAAKTPFSEGARGGIPNRRARRFVPPESLFRDPPADFDRASYRIRAFSHAGFLTAGETLDLGGRVLEVLATPGHSPDSICLIDRKNRILLAGDTWYAGPVFAQLDHSDVDAYAATAQRLAALAKDVDLVLPGHSPPTRDTEVLVRFDAAWRSILDRSARFVERQGLLAPGTVRHYLFDGFWIIMRPRH